MNLQLNNNNKISGPAIRGDISGGLVSGVLALPGNIVFGTIAFSPLGPDYINTGILAAMYSSIFGGLFAALFGSTRGMITGPQAPTALLFASVISQLLVNGQYDSGGQNPQEMILASAFATVFVCGLFQLVFGFFGIGALVKFIPYPVIGGILAGTGLIIIFSQLFPALGIKQLDQNTIFAQTGNIQPLTLLVTLVTVSVMWQGKKLTRIVPASLLGLMAGTALYYLLIKGGFTSQLGPVLGTIPSSLPLADSLLPLIELFPQKIDTTLLSIIVPSAFVMAVLGSIDSLLASVSLQSYTHVRANGNRELRGQGLGNSVSALFGGLPAEGYVSRSIVNFEAGAKTRLSGVIHSLVILGLIFLFPATIGLIPHAVLSGLILFVGFLLVKDWGLLLLRKLWVHKTRLRAELLLNLAIVLTVALSTLLFDFLIALMAGILLSMMVFVGQMSRSVIRRVYRASKVHSRKQRFVKLMHLLAKHGDQIVVIELEGALFFGSADTLAMEIEQLSSPAISTIIIDLKRISKLDSSAVMVVKQIHQQLRHHSIRLLISNIQRESELWQVFTDYGLFSSASQNLFFADLDSALEYAEDQLLTELSAQPVYTEEISLEQYALCRGIQASQVEILKKHLQRSTYQKGDYVCRQGDKGDTLYIILKGCVETLIQVEGNHHESRISTLTAGTMFGELALLEGKPRSASIRAIEPLICLQLSLESFRYLKQHQPQVALAVMDMISKTIIDNLHNADSIITELQK